MPKTELLPLPRDCKVEAIELVLSESRAVTLTGLSIKIFIFEFDNGFQLLFDEDQKEGLVPWYAIEELKELLDWLAQFREPLSGNEELNFNQLWTALEKEKSYSLVRGQT